MTATTIEQTDGHVEKRPNAFVRLYRGETAFDFMGRRRVWYTLSGIVILAGVLSLGIRGLNLGIEFKGGTSWSVPEQGLSVRQVQNAVQSAGLNQPVVQILGGRTVQVQGDLNGLSAQKKQTVSSAVQSALARVAGTNVSAVSIEDVGPTWGSQITDKAIEAMIVFFVLVSIYIAFRFQWRMAVAALLKVILHDLLITIGIFSLTGFQVTPDAVIAVLTIMGYSLYDTVVVFDKITENTRGVGASRRMNYQDLVNLSLNQVLARSLNTSLVAVLPVLSVLVIGGEVLGATTLENFGLPLVIGIVAGAYSSIFIAAPMRSGTKADRARAAQRAGERGALLTPKAAAQLSATRSGAAPVRTGKQAPRKLTASGSRKATGQLVLDEEDESELMPAAAGAARAGGAAKRPAAGAAKRPAGGQAHRPGPRPRKSKSSRKGRRR
jgi:preprotein translocase subunit SecF